MKERRRKGVRREMGSYDVQGHGLDEEPQQGRQKSREWKAPLSSVSETHGGVNLGH